MHQHQETIHLPYSSQQCYELVADVASYPQFLPWCKAARILAHTENQMRAELVIMFHQLRESYTSDIHLEPYERITIEQTKGPFSQLHTVWEFHPDDASGGCTLSFAIRFQFRSKMLDMLIGNLFHKATKKMTTAFVQRAHALYKDAAHFNLLSKS